MSRQEVGVALACEGVPVVELRAAVVLGSGSVSFEMLRYLTERLPFMVCPRWVRTALQPIALTDVIRYLVRALDVAPGIYEIGGADVTTYREMIAAYANARGLRRRRIVDVPYLTPRLSSYWLDLVTPVDRRVSHALVESLVTEVVVRDQPRTDAAFGIAPMGLVDALAAALDDQARALDTDLLGRVDGLRRRRLHGSRRGATSRRTRRHASTPISTASAGATAGTDFRSRGVPARSSAGSSANAGTSTAPPEIIPGASVDWWSVRRRDPGILVLRSIDWFPGEGWLGYRVDGNDVGAGRRAPPEGHPGFPLLEGAPTGAPTRVPRSGAPPRR